MNSNSSIKRRLFFNSSSVRLTVCFSGGSGSLIERGLAIM
jgi:hypothetical protein